MGEGSRAGAAGTDREDSDIDVMVVTGLGLRRLVPAIDRAEQALGRGIHLVRRSAQEWGARVEREHHFTLSLLAGPKLFVIGDDDELRALVGRRQPAPSSPVA